MKIKWHNRTSKRAKSVEEEESLGDFIYMISFPVVVVFIFLLIFLIAKFNVYPSELELKPKFLALLISPTIKLPILILQAGFPMYIGGPSTLAVLGSSAFDFVTAVKLIQSNKFDDIKKLKNLNDPTTNFVKHFYLAVHNECCFKLESESPEVLCNLTEHVQPCVEDEDLFADFKASLDFDGKRCFRITGHDPNGKRNKYKQPKLGNCRESPNKLLKRISAADKRIINSLSILSILVSILFFFVPSNIFINSTFKQNQIKIS